MGGTCKGGHQTGASRRRETKVGKEGGKEEPKELVLELELELELKMMGSSMSKFSGDLRPVEPGDQAPSGTRRGVLQIEEFNKPQPVLSNYH